MSQEHESGSEKDVDGEGEEDVTEENFDIEQCWVIKGRKRTWVPETVCDEVERALHQAVQV